MFGAHLAHRSLPPGPNTPAAIQLWQWLTDGRAFYSAGHQRWGDVFTIRPLGCRPTVCFATPRAAQQILAAPTEVLGHGNEVAAIAVGQHSVILANGTAHKAARKRLRPFFQRKKIEALSPLMIEAIDESIATMPARVPMNFTPVARELTLHVICRALFGMDRVSAHESLFDDLALLAENAQSPASLVSGAILPTQLLSGWVRGQGLHRRRDRGAARIAGMFPVVQSIRHIGEVLLAQLERRRETLDDGGEDLLAQILRRAGSDLDDRLFLDDLITLLLAGHDTTAVTLSWLIQHLTRHPTTMAVLQAEIDAQLDGRAPRADDLARLPYLDAVVTESMRLEPIVPAIARVALQDTEIDGVPIPRGVGINPLVRPLLHHDWPDPSVFNPGRWADRKPRPQDRLAFGGGYRRCVGMGFALLEIKLTLIRLLQRTDIALGTDEPLRPAPSGAIISPAGGAPMVVLSTRSTQPAPIFPGVDTHPAMKCPA